MKDPIAEGVRPLADLWRPEARRLRVGRILPRVDYCWPTKARLGRYAARKNPSRQEGPTSPIGLTASVRIRRRARCSVLAVAISWIFVFGTRPTLREVSLPAVEDQAAWAWRGRRSVSSTRDRRRRRPSPRGPGMFVGEFFQKRRELFARPAPFREEIDQHRLVAS